MALFCGLFISCRYTQANKDDAPNGNEIPSTDDHKNSKSDPNKEYRNPSKNQRDSIMKTRKQSKDLDTLKPIMAMLDFQTTGNR